MSKIKLHMVNGGDKIHGFEVTFSPPKSYYGWPEETHIFGDRYAKSTTELTFTNRIKNVAVLIDTS